MRIFLWEIETQKKLVNNHNETIEIFETHEERRQFNTQRVHEKEREERNLFEWIDREEQLSPQRLWEIKRDQVLLRIKKNRGHYEETWLCSHPEGTYEREREKKNIFTLLYLS